MTPLSDLHHNLPTPLSSFIGRQNEIVEIKLRLSKARLITLSGPGGCGKTRLAIQVAIDLQADYSDGVWLVELATLTDPALVPQVVASTLGIEKLIAPSFTDALIDYFLDHHALLLLDNCEHLIVACAQLAETLLRMCPMLRILATSRENLDIPGEVVWNVPPLSLPDPYSVPDHSNNVTVLSKYEKSEAVQLFVTRATAVLPSFSLTEQNAEWVSEICRRLDGMPLAIELAAARVKMLSVEQIVRRLDDIFQTLTVGRRTALPRHQTLQAAIDWSFNLLTPSEQTMLRRLAVFAGSWSLESAELVCKDQESAQEETLDTLTHLADKSMIMVDRSPGNDVRYRMLETIHEYAWERLRETGESAVYQQKHAETFLRLARQAERTRSSFFWPEIIEVDKLELDLDNYRTALAWCSLDQHGYEIRLRLASALAQFWQMCGYIREGRKVFDTLLSLKMDVSESVLAEAFCYAGFLAMYADDLEAGETFLNKSLALYRKLGDKSGIAWQLGWLGWVSVAQGKLSYAKTFTKQSYALHKELGDEFGAAVALVSIGEAEYLQGDLANAAAAFTESLSLVQDMGIEWVIGRRLIRLGQSACAQNDLQKAAALTKKGLITCVKSGDKSGATMALSALAVMASAQKDFVQAARLLGSVDALHQVYGTAMWYLDRLEYERCEQTLHSRLDEKTLMSAWDEGRLMNLDNAVEYALSEPKISDDLSQKEQHGGLTPRELEVAILIAQGKTNRQIADALVVGLRTVETYVSRILNKLSYDSRVQIATWAIEQGLVPRLPPGDEQDFGKTISTLNTRN
jgi:predicted ATPase/DNA-binding CsgD family transcriptional regulator